MTTSGTNTFNLVTDEIINLAYSRIGLYSEFHDLTAFQRSQGLTLLNTMTKSLKVYGDYLWKTARGTLWLVNGVSEYILDGSTANATEDYVETINVGTALSGATSIVVYDNIGISIGYFIGIYTDNNSLFWTKVSGVSGTTISLTAPLPYSLSDQAQIFCYQTKINRPMTVPSLQTQLNATTQVDCVKLSRNSYDRIPIKNSILSFPSQFYYNLQLTYGNITLWPTPNNETQYVKFTFQKQFFDFADPTNTPDFPSEWLKPLYLNLAVVLAGHNGIRDPQFISDLKAEAVQALQDAKGYDNEETSIYIQPASVTNTNTYR